MRRESSMTSRRRFLGTASAAMACAVTAARLASAGGKPKASSRRRSPWIDALGFPIEADASPFAPLGERTLDALRASGLSAVNVTVGGAGDYAKDFDTSVRTIAHFNQEIAAHPDRLMQVRTAADIAQAQLNGRMGLIYGFQDGTPIGEDLGRIDLFADLGVRVFQLTYNRRNLIADGCLEPGNAGLSAFGNEVVARLNERRLLVDLSHGGERMTREAIEASRAPVAITHTGCAALAPLPRNKTDAELRMLADKGGVVGIYLIPMFLRAQGHPGAEDLVLHIEHAIDVCGEDHVGIGSDGFIPPVKFDDAYRERADKRMAERRARGIAAPGERPGVYTFLPDLNTADRFAQLAQRLASRGHSESRIDKILGGNFARLFAAVWAS